MRPIQDAGDAPVLDRIPVIVIHMALKIAVIPNLMLPEAALPQQALPPLFARGAARAAQLRTIAAPAVDADRY